MPEGPLPSGGGCSRRMPSLRERYLRSASLAFRDRRNPYIQGRPTAQGRAHSLPPVDALGSILPGLCQYAVRGRIPHLRFGRRARGSACPAAEVSKSRKNPPIDTRPVIRIGRVAFESAVRLRVNRATRRASSKRKGGATPAARSTADTRRLPDRIGRPSLIAFKRREYRDDET